MKNEERKENGWRRKEMVLMMKQYVHQWNKMKWNEINFVNSSDVYLTKNFMTSFQIQFIGVFIAFDPIIILLYE